MIRRCNHHSIMQKHWVEELFPPTYAYSIDELLKPSTCTDDTPVNSIATHTTHSNTPDTCHDLKDLYERVRVDFNQEIQDRRQKSVQIGSPLSENFVLPVDESDIPDESVRQKKQQLELDCIWSQSDLRILRDVYQKANTDLAGIKIKLSMVEEAKKRVTEQCKKQVSELKRLGTLLRQSQQQSKRLNIKCGHLESELQHFNGKVKMLEEDETDLLQENRTLKKRLREVQKEVLQERSVRTDIELRLQEDSHKLKLEHIATEEKLKLDYQMQINRLYRELRENQEAFEKEQKTHGINKKALNHLRTHFASLPLTDLVGSSHDRLTSIQY